MYWTDRLLEASQCIAGLAKSAGADWEQTEDLLRNIQEAADKCDWNAAILLFANLNAHTTNTLWKHNKE